MCLTFSSVIHSLYGKLSQKKELTPNDNSFHNVYTRRRHTSYTVSRTRDHFGTTLVDGMSVSALTVVSFVHWVWFIEVLDLVPVQRWILPKLHNKVRLSIVTGMRVKKRYFPFTSKKKKTLLNVLWEILHDTSYFYVSSTNFSSCSCSLVQYRILLIETL